MRMRLYALFLLLVSFSVFGKGVKIAVVDLKKVATESSAGKSIEEQVKKINNDSKAELSEIEGQIKSMDNTKKTSADTHKIEELQVMLYDMVREKKYAISAGYNKAITQLDKEIKQVIKELCKRKKINVVIAQDAIVYFDDSACVNITSETINELNKRNLSIRVRIEAN